MYIFDTDHFSILQRNEDNLEKSKLIQKLREINESKLSVTVITYQEQIQGWIGYINKAKNNLDKQLVGYRGLREQLTRYCNISVLDFDESAAIEFQILKKQYRRIGTMDLKIAAIALSLNAILLTRNIKDFGQIENLEIDDWTR